MALSSTTRTLGYAFLGGFIGAVLMVLVMIAAGKSLGMPQVLLLRALGVSVLGIAPADFTATMLGGLIIHLINGTFIIPTILVTAMLAVKRGLLITNVKRGLPVGLLAGFLVYIIFGLPMLYFVMAPGAVKAVAFTMQLPSGTTPMDVIPMVKAMLVMKIGYVAVAFFLAHLVYGASWGVLVGLGMSRAPGAATDRVPGAGSHQFKCPTCGASFSSQDELMQHSKAHMSSTPRQDYKCPACGATFASQQELTDHKAKAHPM